MPAASLGEAITSNIEFHVSNSSNMRISDQFSKVNIIIKDLNITTFSFNEIFRHPLELSMRVNVKYTFTLQNIFLQKIPLQRIFKFFLIKPFYNIDQHILKITNHTFNELLDITKIFLFPFNLVYYNISRLHCTNFFC